MEKAAGTAALEELLEIQKSALAATWNLLRKLHAAPVPGGLEPELLPELEAIQRSQKRIKAQTTNNLLQFDGAQARTDRLREAEALQFETLSALHSARRDASRLEHAFSAGRAAYEALYRAGFPAGMEGGAKQP
jgi:hypothetical protein